VVVPLPFVAARVTFDDRDHELVPAADVAAFDVPVESGARHRVAAIAIDGTRAEGYVREEDGVARADSEGFAMSAATSRPTTPPPRAFPGPVRPPPVGTVRNGFTKLR
jgi:hypothetical protein